MSTPQLAEIVKTLEKALGDSLIALFLVGSAPTEYYIPGRSDINLFLVIKDDLLHIDVLEIMRAYWVLWEDTLLTPPLLASQTAFQRHLQLNPTLTDHMLKHSRLLSGKLTAPFPRPDKLEILASYCSEAIDTSAALAPGRLAPEAAQTTYNQLHRLTRRMYNRPVSEKASPRQLFTLVQRALQAEIKTIQKTTTNPPQPSLPAGKNLEAIFFESQRVVFVIPEIGERDLMALDWPVIFQSSSEQFQTIGIATATQLRLSLFIDRPIDYALNRYEHQWGRDILNGRPVSRPQIYKALARHASSLLVGTLPQQCLKAGHADQKFEVIHDLQNRILNLHLQAELLRRLHGYPFSIPSIQLPGRETPVDQRISALFKRLDYWATYYTAAGELQDSQ